MSTRRGFILPTTLMVMTLLTVMLSAAFVMVSAEFRASDNALAQSRANSLAQAGMQDYLSRNRYIGFGTSYDSLRITYTAGYADVVASRLVPSSGSKQAIWLVRSTGYITGSLLSGQVQAQRTVAQLSTLNPGVLPVKAAFVAANPININGISGLMSPIDSTDACNVKDSAGLVVASADLLGTYNGVAKRTSWTRAAILDSTHIDWTSLVNGNFTPDYTVPPFPSAAVMNTFPIMYSSGSLYLTTNGSGILVVKGDLTIGITESWRGIIIVGGRVVGPPLSWASITGSVMSGLNNITAPGSVGTDTLFRGLFGFGVTGFQWSSCAADSAAASESALAPLRHTFMDTWATY